MINRIQRYVRRRAWQWAVPHYWDASLSYSQSGEDMIVSYIFALRGIRQPSYIDIGAHHPFHLSNTAIFYRRGSRGINIEPNPTLIREFQRHRAEDINLCFGIGEAEAVLDFYIMQAPVLSTFSATDAQALVAQGQPIKEVVKVPITSLRKIIAEHSSGGFPDFLTIDVEGMELEILRSIDFATNGPKIICAESKAYSNDGTGAKDRSVIEFLSSRGYHAFADTNLNTIFVQNSWWEKPATPDGAATKASPAASPAARASH